MQFQRFGRFMFRVGFRAGGKTLTAETRRTENGALRLGGRFSRSCGSGRGEREPISPQALIFLIPYLSQSRRAMWNAHLDCGGKAAAATPLLA